MWVWNRWRFLTTLELGIALRITVHYWQCFKHRYYITWRLMTSSMENSRSWGANWSPAGQEISKILCSPAVHYRIHNNPPPVAVLSQSSPVHTPSYYFLNIRFNTIFLSTPRTSKWSLSLRFPHQNAECYSPVSHSCHIHRPSHSAWFYHSNVLWGLEGL